MGRPSVSRRADGPLLCLLLAIIASFVASPVHAQDDPPASDEPATSTDPALPTDPASVGGTLTIVSQSSYVAADGVFTVVLDWSGPILDQLSIGSIVRGRLDPNGSPDEQPGVLNRVAPVPLVTVLAPDGRLQIDLAIRSFSPPVPGEPERLLVPEAGVYPVEFEIRDSFGTVASITTHLIRLPTETAEIPLLPVATILPVSVGDGLQLDDAIDLLERHPNAPVAVFLESGVVSELIDDPARSVRLRGALGMRTLLVRPIVDLDPSALQRIGQGALYTASVEDTEAKLAAVGLSVSRSLLAIEPDLTVEGADLLLSMGVETVFDLSGSASGVLNTPTGRLRVVVADDLNSMLTSGVPAVEAAHRLLARLALQSEIETTPVVLGGPDMRGADFESLDVLFGALELAGPLTPIDLATSATSLPSISLRPIESPSQDLSALAGPVADALTLLTTYESFHLSGPTDPTIFRETLISALSRERNPSDRSRSIEQLQLRLAESLDVVTVRDRQSVTLTARRLTVPLTIDNSSAGDRRVMLRFDSDKVAVDENNQIFDLPPGPTTLQINVEARSLGVSPLDVAVLTPDGTQVLSTTRLQIRSTAIPGLGLLLSAAALTFLIGWWIVSIGRSRAHKHRPDPEPDDGAPTDSAPSDGRAAPEGVNVPLDDSLAAAADDSTLNETSP